MKKHETLARVTGVLKIKDGFATIRYTTLGGEGQVEAYCGGWGDAYKSFWPPQVGDEIRIVVNPTVHLTRRPPSEHSSV